jgi:hypothetical protein
MQGNVGLLVTEITLSSGDLMVRATTLWVSAGADMYAVRTVVLSRIRGFQPLWHLVLGKELDAERQP